MICCSIFTFCMIFNLSSLILSCSPSRYYLYFSMWWILLSTVSIAILFSKGCMFYLVQYFHPFIANKLYTPWSLLWWTTSQGPSTINLDLFSVQSMMIAISVVFHIDYLVDMFELALVMTIIENLDMCSCFILIILDQFIQRIRWLKGILVLISH